MEKRNTIKLSEAKLKQIISESIKKALAESNSVNEISSNLLRRAADKAHKDELRDWGTKFGKKRGEQWAKFSKAAIERDREEKDSVCPSVPESELESMPEDTYVVLDGNGRDAISADFRYRYSGHAGTEEQCMAYVDKYYDKNANWEYLPDVVPLEQYLKNRTQFK